MKGNIRGKEAPIFVGVGVAQHDFNGLGSAWGQRGLVQDALKEIWRPVQIFYGFEERNHWGSVIIEFEAHFFHEQPKDQKI